MKKLILLLSVMLMSGLAAQAQTTIENSQARVLDVETDAIVRPQVVDLQILKNLPTTGGVISSNAVGRCVWKCNFSKKEVDGLKGEISEIRANASFKMCDELGADVILAATYNIKTENFEKDGIEVKVIGFPAIFTNWRDLDSQKDGEWIRLKVLNKSSESNNKTKAITE